MSKPITPEYLFDQIIGTAGISDEDAETDGDDIVSISRDHLLLIAFAGTNAILNLLVNKGIINKRDIEEYVGGSVRAITEMFDFDLNDK